MTTPVIIVGAGDLALELCEWIRISSLYNVMGFIDDNENALKDTKQNYKLLSSVSEFEPNDTPLLMGISDPATKLQLANQLKQKGAVFVSYIDPTAIIVDDAELGEGVVICPNAVISRNVKLGDFITINVGTAIGHDTTIGNGTTLSSLINICGHVKIEDCVFLGSGAVVIPNKKLGKHSKVAAGAVVFQNVKPESTVVGNPAKKIK